MITVSGSERQNVVTVGILYPEDKRACLWPSFIET